MMRFNLLKNQKGDTIIEVMFALVVLATAIGVSYGVANRSLRTARTAQERTEALKVAESQAEKLKMLSDNGTALPPQSLFCIKNNSADVYNSGYPGDPPSLDSDALTQYDINGCSNGRYKYFVDPGATNTYTINVRWFGAGSIQKEEVKIIYRVK